MAIRQLVTFAVPAFLFISGYFIAFMARGESSKVTWGMVLPRIKVLAIPFVIWTTIRYLLLRRFPTSLDEVLDPYHFIPLLIQFYLLSPLLVPIAKKHWRLFLLIAAFLHLSVQGLRYINELGINYPGQDIFLALTQRWIFIGQQPFWFPFGLVFGLHAQQFQAWLAPHKKALLTGTFAFGSMAILEFEAIDYLNGELILSPSFGGFTRTFFILAFLLMFLATSEITIPFPDKISSLSARSLGIYLGNIPAIYITAVLMYRFTPFLLGKQLLYQGILFLVGVGGPYLLMELVRRSPARRWYRSLFG
jgi:surface polysaccharide O-acyltransferase-like enzyme